MTGAELRHDFVRTLLALTSGVHVRRAYCEDMRLEPIVSKQEGLNSERLRHLAMRTQSEQDFFFTFTKFTPDHCNPVFIRKGEINDSHYVEEIVSLKPDILIAYGCSIIKEPLLRKFDRKILNVHLGLSPYFRGSSTNYWPLVKGWPEYVGATFMYMDPGIDTGEIIHQIRARIFPGDSPHQIGNRLICDVALVYAEIIRNYENLNIMEKIPESFEVEYFRRDDFSEQSVRILYNNFSDGMIDDYLGNVEERCGNVPIIENPAVRDVETLKETPL